MENIDGKASMKTRKVLMASSNNWASPLQVGSHHLARTFIRSGFDVAYISHPISPLHIFSGVNSDLRRRFDFYRSGGTYDLEGRLWTYVPGALLTPHNKPLLRNSFVLKHWSKLTLPNIINKVRRMGFGDVDLLYLDNACQFFFLNNINYKKSVFRVADLISGYGHSTTAIEQMEQKTAQRVDRVVYTAVNLKEYVSSLRPKSMSYLPNGVDFHHFSNKPKNPPPEYATIPEPRVVYVGAMNEWFDYDLVNLLAEQLRKVSFILIGPQELAKKRLQSLPNLHLLGKRTHTTLPAYLHYAHVGIIPFDVKNHSTLIHSVNPIKLYEYMACGLPVVSVEWKELKTLNSPAMLARTKDEFRKNILECIERPLKPEVYIDYAAQRDWQKQFEPLIQWMNQ